LAEDAFFPRFMDAVSKIGPPNTPFNDSFRDVYLSYWREFAGKTLDLPSFAVADGSRSSTTFRGGIRVVCVRALANVYVGNKLVGNVSDVDVRAGHRLRRASLYMRALEFKCLKKAIESNDVLLAVCDGDLYPSIHPIIVKRTGQEVEAYIEYLKALCELYECALKRNVMLVGLTKDSFVNYLRAKVLSQYIIENNIELDSEISRIRSIKNVEKRLKEKKIRSKNLEVLVKEASRLSSDEEIYDEYAAKPGFSVPLVLAPQPIYLSEEIKAGTKTWRGSKIRRRLKARNPPFRDVADAFDRLFSLPPIVLSYWRP